MPIDKEQFKKTIKSDWKDRIQTELFDTKDVNGKAWPQWKFKRWDNEVNYSVRLKETDTEDPVIVEEDGKTKWKKSKHEVHFYEKPVSADHPSGAGEVELVLKEKPDTNVFEFSIETKGLVFTDQLALTQEELAMGLRRPENASDSIAVYYASHPRNIEGQKIYGNGKAFHIYRIKATDANGEWVWGKQHVDVDLKLHTVEIPQEFLNKAQYPVVIDPTFGYDTMGTTTTYINNKKKGGIWTLSEGGDVSKITASLGNDATGTTTVKGIIADDTGGTMKAKSGEYSIVNNGKAWKDLTMSVTLTADDWYFVLWGKPGTSSEWPVVACDSGGTAYWAGVTYVDGTDDWVFDEGKTSFAYTLSIYATYTAGATSPAPSVYDEVTVSEDVSVWVVSDTIYVSVFDSISIVEDLDMGNGSSWDPANYAHLLQENGAALLQENGAYILFMELNSPRIKDYVSVTDSVDLFITGYYLEVSDDVTVSESSSVSANTLVSVYDSVTVSETSGVTTSSPAILVYEPVVVSETVNVYIPSEFPWVFNWVYVSESVNITVSSPKVSVYDSVTITENITARVSNPLPSVYDSVTVSENVNIFVPKLTPAVYDSVAVTDLPNIFITKLFLSPYDSVTVLDNINPVAVSHVGVNDSVTVSELYSWIRVTTTRSPSNRPQGSADFVSMMGDRGYDYVNVTPW